MSEGRLRDKIALVTGAKVGLTGLARSIAFAYGGGVEFTDGWMNRRVNLPWIISDPWACATARASICAMPEIL
ncbi:MAG: hypothetical protein LBQ57_13655 [Spirochaetales bacterium]|nr:hypothetical protein [Spirochaetales bacterium]